uniref:Reverse transcriptase domain-containing protein n=1 Tax=Trichogramma kaykai TaxID=54128 RepID=A0ABD2X8T5_9HYME
MGFDQTSVAGISTHDFLTATLALRVRMCEPSVARRRCYRNFDRELFLRDLSESYCPSVCRFESVDEKVDLFTRTITALYDRHAPYRDVVRTTRAKPWYSPELKRLRVARDKAWRTFRRTRTDDDRASYKILRNRFRTAARDAACRHYRERFRDCSDSASKWRTLGQLGLGSRAGGSAELPVSVDELNQHFVGAFQSRVVDPETPVSSVHPDERFYFRHVQLFEVVEAVARTQTESSPRDARDFRPISLLCAMSKILERLAHAQLTDYIESRKLLNKYQSGFRGGNSTQTALLRIMDDVREAVESQEVTLIAAVDLSRAFDVVNHSILLNKLKRLGWSDLTCCWIQFYLAGRTQLVIGPRGERSATLPRRAGVRQGQQRPSCPEKLQASHLCG